MTDLKVDYRPRTWDEVIGHGVQVNSLRSLVESNASHSYLLAGPSGVGKTTLARIAAAALGCEAADLTEIDGATNTGIDAMREVTANAWHLPLLGAVRAVIIDECHRISANAFDSLLKIIEEPPGHMYWFLCTTRVDKVPATIASRCARINLPALDRGSLDAILGHVCSQEDLNLDPEIANLCVDKADGSARALLGNIEAVRGAGSWDDAHRLLDAAEASEETKALGYYLIGAERTWQGAMKVVEALAHIEPETTRIGVRRYVAAVAKKAKTDRSAIFYLRILDHFAEPYISADGDAPLLQSIGHALFEQQ